MALDLNFNDVEHLQATIRRYLNPQIREDFRDLGGDNWEPTIATTRAAMRTALTHKDNDSLEMTAVRLLTYYFVFGKLESLMLQGESSSESRDYPERSGKPKIKLCFANNPVNAKKEGYVTGYISFRLMGESNNTLTKAEAEKYANKIKALFATPRFKWEKGKILCSYTDWDLGYQFQLLVRTVSEAKRIVEQVLDIQGHSPKWERFQRVINDKPNERYPKKPSKVKALDKQIQPKEQRPTVDVYFTHATLSLGIKGKPIILLDTLRRYKNALVQVK